MPTNELEGLFGLDLRRSVAVVTEVAQHPGDEIARFLGSAGATVVALSRDRVAGERVVAGLRDQGFDSLFIDADPDCVDGARDLLDEVHRRFTRVDLLVTTSAPHRPGQSWPRRAPAAVGVFGEHFAARGHGAVIAVGASSMTCAELSGAR